MTAMMEHENYLIETPILDFSNEKIQKLSTDIFVPQFFNHLTPVVNLLNFIDR